jgi:ArsR family transcriptional regulator
MDDRPTQRPGDARTPTDEDLARAARALAHPARIHIVRLLASQDSCRGADVFSELPLAQSTISEHIRILKDAGLVSATPRGTGMVYCLVPEAVSTLGAALGSIAESSCAPTREECS